ncbi:MAG: prefoldin subunit beta [archaeon GB-1867-035]|nr:prefoldin subunit beta [Candidatus Culexmicrobium profundum]
MTQKIPPEVENKLIRLQELQEQLRLLSLRRQQLEFQLREVEHALDQVKDLSADVELYKSTGYVMFRTSKEQIVDELTDKKETLELRLKTIEKQEKLVRKEFEELRRDLSKMLASTGTT